jgi:hypothetical protein
MPLYIYVPITFLTWHGRVHVVCYVFYIFSNDFLTSHGCVHVVCYVFYIFVFQ